MAHRSTRLFCAALLAAAVLPASGCMTAMMTGHMTAMEADYNAPQPKIYVHRPERLARVSKVVVPDFRVSFVSQIGKGTEKAFKGSAAEGVYYYASEAYGTVLAEYFEEQLLKAPGLEVLERNRLKGVLSEQSLQQLSGQTDAPASEGGQFGGADTILLGTVTQALYYQPNEPYLPRMVMGMINVRLVDIATGDIILIYRDHRMATGGVIDPEGVLEAFATRFVATLLAAKAGP